MKRINGELEIKSELKKFIEAYGKSLDSINEITKIQTEIMCLKKGLHLQEHIKYIQAIDRMKKENEIAEMKLEKLITLIEHLN